MGAVVSSFIVNRQCVVNVSLNLIRKCKDFVVVVFFCQERLLNLEATCIEKGEQGEQLTGVRERDFIIADLAKTLDC